MKLWLFPSLSHIDMLIERTERPRGRERLDNTNFYKLRMTLQLFHSHIDMSIERSERTRGREILNNTYNT